MPPPPFFIWGYSLLEISEQRKIFVAHVQGSLKERIQTIVKWWLLDSAVRRACAAGGTDHRLSFMNESHCPSSFGGSAPPDIPPRNFEHFPWAGSRVSQTYQARECWAPGGWKVDGGVGEDSGLVSAHFPIRGVSSVCISPSVHYTHPHQWLSCLNGRWS